MYPNIPILANLLSPVPKPENQAIHARAVSPTTSTQNCPRLTPVQSWSGSTCHMIPRLIPCGKKAATAPCPLDLANSIKALDVMPMENMPDGNDTVMNHADDDGAGDGGVDAATNVKLGIVAVVLLAVVIFLVVVLVVLSWRKMVVLREQRRRGRARRRRRGSRFIMVVPRINWYGSRNWSDGPADDDAERGVRHGDGERGEGGFVQHQEMNHRSVRTDGEVTPPPAYQSRVSGLGGSGVRAMEVAYIPRGGGGGGGGGAARKG